MKRMFQTIVLGLTLAAASTATLAAEAPLPGDSVYQIQATLTDQDGRPLEWRGLRGRPAVVSMFYANCHLMCPLIVASGKALQKRLTPDEYASLDLAMLSIDPARDTPAALKEVASTHQLDLDRWHLLRPADGDVRALAAVLGVRYRAQPDGTFNHTSVLVLLDGEGRVVARSEVTGLQPDAAFVDKVRETLASSR